MDQEYFFPLSNIRKTIDGNWNVLQIIEYRKIPESDPYILRLKEVPDSGAIISSPSISALSGSPGEFQETTSSPAPGQFLVRYNSGHIQFNSSDKNKEIKITYYGLGSAISAEDINYLKSLIDSNYHHSVSSNKLFIGTQNLAPSGYSDIHHGLNTNEFLVQIQYKSPSYNNKWTNARAVLDFEIIDENTIRINNNSDLEINSLNWRVLISIFNTPIYYISNNIPIGMFEDIVHNLGSIDLLFQIQWKPLTGPHAGKWIDGESISSASIIDENIIRIYNNGNIEIPSNHLRLLISMF